MARTTAFVDPIVAVDHHDDRALIQTTRYRITSAPRVIPMVALDNRADVRHTIMLAPGMNPLPTVDDGAKVQRTINRFFAPGVKGEATSVSILRVLLDLPATRARRATVPGNRVDRVRRILSEKNSHVPKLQLGRVLRRRLGQARTKSDLPGLGLVPVPAQNARPHSQRTPPRIKSTTCSTTPIHSILAR